MEIVADEVKEPVAAVELLPAWPELTVELIGRDGPAGSQPGGMKARLREMVPAALRDRVVFRQRINDPTLPRNFREVTIPLNPDEEGNR